MGLRINGIIYVGDTGNNFNMGAVRTTSPSNYRNLGPITGTGNSSSGNLRDRPGYSLLFPGVSNAGGLLGRLGGAFENPENQLDFGLLSPADSGDPLDPCSAQYRARGLTDVLEKSPSRGETYLDPPVIKKERRPRAESNYNHGTSDLDLDQIFGSNSNRAFEEGFIFPTRTIREINTTANRELVLINNYFFERRHQETFGTPRTALLSINQIPQSKGRANACPFRFTSGRVWCFKKGEETLVSSEVLPGSPHAGSLAGAEVIPELGIPFAWSLPADGEVFSGNVSRSRLMLRFDHQLSSNLTDNFSDFDDLFPVFLDVYTYGHRSDHYDEARHSKYHYGLLPEPGKVYLDQVFSAEAPFFEQEMDVMNVSQFTNASIKPIVHNYVEEESTYKGQPAEYSKPSIYRVYNDTVINGDLTRCPEEDKIQKFPCSKVTMFDEINSTFKDTFDKYVSISINTQQALKIASFLHEERMDKYILELVTGWVPPAPDAGRPQTSEGKVNRTLFPGKLPGSKNEIFTEVMDEVIFQPGKYNTLLPDESNDRFINDVVRRTWTGIDALFSMEGILLHSFKSKLKQYPLYIDRYDPQYPEGSHRLIKFWDSISSQIFMSRADSFIEIESLNRTLSEILNGEKAYSEIVGYKICKYAYGPKGVIEEPLQEFYVMDSDSIRTIEFIDTQVLSGRKYLYRIFSLNFVVASAYTMLNTGQLHVSGKTMETLLTADIITRPIVSIIEAPFFQQEVVVVEAPPMAPTVTFLPYEGDDEHLRILIQASTGKTLEEPILLLESDKGLIEKMLLSQNPDAENKILYKSDNNPDYFQVFRIDELPETGEELMDIFGDNSDDNDVGQKILNLKGENYAKIVESRGRNAFVEDVLERNKYYYYIFRSIDAAGISNPTNYFRVRLVSYENGIFLEVEPIELKVEEKSLRINFERFIEIRPSKKQEAIWFGANVDFEDRDFYKTVPDYYDLGHTRGDKSVWDRRFKLRVKSLSSKRSVDINFKFSKEFHHPHVGINSRGGNKKPCDPANEKINKMPPDKPRLKDSKNPGGIKLKEATTKGKHYRPNLPFSSNGRFLFPSSKSSKSSKSPSGADYGTFDKVGNYVMPWFMGK